MKILRSAAILAATLATSVAAPCFAPSAFATIGNGSFEYPTVPAGMEQSHNVGTWFGKWQVVGPPGTSVSVLSAPFVVGGYSFPPQAGLQMLDLTGHGINQAEGVQQRTRTVPYVGETIHFWIGNISGPGWGTSSTVNVYVNNVPLCSRTNSTPGTTLNWQLFSCSFVPNTWTTTIRFTNGDPPGDNSNILDNIWTTTP